jgi:pimeloyl-ACP methyl ester carboxylesterase
VLVLVLLVLAAVLLPMFAHASTRVPITIRGKTLTLETYLPSTGTPRGTVFMGSGDVGWVGLAVDLAEFLQKQGYFVVGINVRQYLASFTSGSSHVMPADIAGDLAAMAQLMRERNTFWTPVVVAGVSEGAAIAVVAGSSKGNHAWITGVITMGLPPTAELAWRWSDVGSWITKRDPNEPEFEPRLYIADVSPLPLFMIQSTKDEYVREADYRMFESTAKAPKRLVLIEASNHRFTDRLPELRTQFLAGLAWILDPK